MRRRAEECAAGKLDCQFFMVADSYGRRAVSCLTERRRLVQIVYNQNLHIWQSQIVEEIAAAL